MMLDNHAANSESQSGAIRLGRNKRSKYAIQLCWIDSRTRVFHRNGNFVAVTKRRSHAQNTIANGLAVHRFEAVLEQISNHFAQLATMAAHKRQFGRQLNLDFYRLTPQLILQRLCHIENNLVQIDWLQRSITPPKQNTNTIKDIADRVRGTYGPLESAPCSLKIWRRLLDKSQSCGTGSHNCRQRLSDFMTNRGYNRLGI